MTHHARASRTCDAPGVAGEGSSGPAPMHPRPWGSGRPYCAPGLGPCPEGALVCEETDEPLNGGTCPQARRGLAHGHHAPPAPQAPPGAGVMDTDVGAKRLFPPPFPPSLFPRLCKGFPPAPHTGAWPEGSLCLQPCSARFQKARTGRSHYAPSSGLRLLSAPCPQVPAGLPLTRQCSSPRTGLGAS